MTIEVNEFRKKKEEILSSDLEEKMKTLELTYLFTNMSSYYDIPLEYGNDYRYRNKEVVSEFEAIADEIRKLNKV